MIRWNEPQHKQTPMTQGSWSRTGIRWGTKFAVGSVGLFVHGVFHCRPTYRDRMELDGIVLQKLQLVSRLSFNWKKLWLGECIYLLKTNSPEIQIPVLGNPLLCRRIKIKIKLKKLNWHAIRSLFPDAFVIPCDVTGMFYRSLGLFLELCCTVNILLSLTTEQSSRVRKHSVTRLNCSTPRVTSRSGREC